ncbi:MAG: fimbrillin family protein [Bacteroidaceae bacterium]|nr:fimbrillin family protein [Bacteroidaceae bacterium]
MKKTILLAAMAAMFISCENKQNTEPPVNNKIPINIEMGVWTRATDSSFEAGDEVGIYVVNYNDATPGTLAASGNHADNVRYTFSSTWTPDKEIYWKDQTTKADIYAYYPYAQPTNVNAYAFSVNADQSTEDNYWGSDFLWGKASAVSPTSQAVPVTTHHSFSNALLYIVPGDGFTANDLAAANIEVKICNVKTGASINLATGVATATGTATDIKPLNTGAYYRALIVPQTVADGTNLVTVKIDDVTYTYAKGMTFVANTQHKLTIKVNKTGNGVNIGIGEWETDDEDYGGSAE